MSFLFLERICKPADQDLFVSAQAASAACLQIRGRPIISPGYFYVFLNRQVHMPVKKRMHEVRSASVACDYEF